MEWRPWFDGIRSQWEERRAERSQARSWERDLRRTELSLQCALSFALQVQEYRFHFVEHCARVARLVRHLAERVGLPEEDAAALRHAAEMHELGMVAVPHELIRAPRPLTSEELEWVREQARIGAAIVRAAYAARKADLIERQYTDFAELRSRLPGDGPELLMAGLLRVADVFDTLTHPRPYQRGIPAWRWMEVLEEGVGSRFHPEAAEALLALHPLVPTAVAEDRPTAGEDHNRSN